MEYSDFVASVDALLVEKDLAGQRWQEPLPSEFRHSYRSEKSKPAIMDGLLVEWVTGGIEGGNWTCNSDPRSYVSDEPPAELTSVVVIFEELCPAISYLAFRRFEKLVKSGDYTNPEYYGNETRYAFRYIPLRDFYHFLSDENLLDHNPGVDNGL